MNDLAVAIDVAEKAIREIADELRDAENPIYAQRLRRVADSLSNAIKDSLSKTKESPELMDAIERARAKIKK